DLAIERLREYAADYRAVGRPFSLDLHFFGPHLPYIIPGEYFDLIDPDLIELPPSFGETFAGKPQIQSNYSRYWSTDSFSADEWRKLIAIYHGYVSLIDLEIGRVLAELHALGLTDSTAVFFCADHGEFTGAHRLNDKGPMAYEDILRIPMIVRAPGSNRNQRSAALVSLLDVPATILDLAGIQPTLVIDGRSLVPHLLGDGTGSRDELLCEFHGHHFPLQQRILVTDRYKLVVSPESLNELYDLATDPFELTNRYTAPVYDQLRRGLLVRLYQILVERGDLVFAKWMLATTDVPLPIDTFSGTAYARVAPAGDEE
ncbi:MAG: sulfatase/phosphatase domain-containing protein, partial [Propionibacteriaceae bacterium]